MRGKQIYTVLDHKYCSCRSFYEMQSSSSSSENLSCSDSLEKNEQQLNKSYLDGETYLCKHIFAAYLAPYLDRLSTVYVLDEDFYKYMINA